MIRIHPGRAWRQNPRLLSQLRAATGERALSRTTIVDSVGIEIDGVDLAAGLSEDSVLQVTSELAVAIASLAAGRNRSSVAFRAAGVDLLLERRQDRVRLSFIKLQRPAGVVMRGVEVELEALCRAALDCGRALLRDLGALNPALVEGATARRLANATRRLSGAARPSGGAVPGLAAARTVHAETPGFPTCAFDLQDAEGVLGTFRGSRPDLQSLLVRGRMSLRLTQQAALWAGEGYLFLMLREQTANGLSLVRALEAGELEHLLPLCDGGSLPMDLENGRARVRGGRRDVACDPVALARCLFEASRLFVRLVVTRNAAQKDNGYLAELRRSAQEGLARCAELLDPPAEPRRKVRGKPKGRRGPAAPEDPPLAPGRLRRLSYRQLWSAKIPPPTSLCLSGDTLVVLSEEGSVGLSTHDGTTRWKGPGGPGLAAALADGGLLVAGGRRLARFGSDGHPVWSSAIVGSASPPASLCVSSDGRQATLASATEVAAYLLEAGRPLWRFSPPGCSALNVSAAPGLSIVATSDGRLYGIDPVEGRLRWRSRLGAKPVGPVLVWGQSAAVLTQRPEGAGLNLLSLANGKATQAAPPELARPGSACLAQGQCVVAGTLGGEGEVVAYAEGGAPVWRCGDHQLGPGMPQLCPVPDGIVVRGSRLTVCLDARGKPRWQRLFDEELHGGPAPCLRRGVLLLAAERGVLGLDPATGQLLGQAGEEDPLWPALLVADDRLTIYSAEEDGPLEAYGLGTFLSVV